MTRRRAAGSLPAHNARPTRGRFRGLYVCPADQRLTYRYTNEENGLSRHHYWTNVCPSCPIKELCTTGKERRLTRWEHEHVLEAVQRRLDENPQAMRQRRETVEHPFGTLKAWMGATHFLMKRECQIFRVCLIRSMLPERSRDDDNNQRVAGRTSEGLRAA